MFLHVIGFYGALYAFWHLTQWCIGKRSSMTGAIEDLSHKLLAAPNRFLLANHGMASVGIVITSALLDISLVCLAISDMIYGLSVASVALGIGVVLRQVCMCAVRLQRPQGLLWFDPGIPSLIVPYEVEDDFFFSGHTLTSVTVALHFCVESSAGMITKALICLFPCLEIMWVLVTRAHYFMDVYAGATTAIAVYSTVAYFYT